MGHIQSHGNISQPHLFVNCFDESAFHIAVGQRDQCLVFELARLLDKNINSEVFFCYPTVFTYYT